MYKSRIWCLNSCLAQSGERDVTGGQRTTYHVFQHVLFACSTNICVCAVPHADVGVCTPVWMDGETEDQPWLSSVAVYLALLSQGLSLAYSLPGSLCQLLSGFWGLTISLSLALAPDMFTLMPGSFMCVPGVYYRSSCLHGNHSTDRTRSSALDIFLQRKFCYKRLIF